MYDAMVSHTVLILVASTRLVDDRNHSSMRKAAVNGPIGEEWRDSHAISDDLAREETSSDGVRWI
ncbi:hypothetical protein C4D60_Mb08t14960 [Musa balbisiana]|uniref:Uncharacterized protein n=1 Tax=Musa balbisiana TaxID=52838 RepID=A0A4S8K3V8_MUSBA|nr:hypothetical protein C4D60_Mb08t14960 [Musa balbisiana]